MTRRINRFAGAAALVAVTALAACTTANATSTIAISGSATVQPITQALATAVSSLILGCNPTAILAT